MQETNLELRHDGQRWFLDVTIDGKFVEICISYEDKEKLEEAGCPFYSSDDDV